MASPFSPVSAVAESLSFLVRRPLVVLAWAGLHLVVALPMVALVRLVLSGGAGTMPALLIALVLWAVTAPYLFEVTYTAAVRSVLEPQPAGFGYLRFGLEERRALAFRMRRNPYAFLWYVGLTGVFIATVVPATVIANLALSPAVRLLLALPVIVGGGLTFVYWAARHGLARPMAYEGEREPDARAFSQTAGRGWPLVGLSLLSHGLWLAVAALAVWAAVVLWPYLPRDGNWTAPGPVDMLDVRIVMVAVAFALVSALGRALCDRPVASAYKAMGRRLPETPGMSSAALRTVTG